jgi:hypothetical protein
VRRRVGGALVVLLAVVTGVVVVLALRAPTPPASSGSSSPPLGGTIAVHGADAWRWVGPKECNPAADAVPLERLTADGWVGSDVPLANVTRMSFSDRRHGIALGTTSTCALGVALTEDGGVTWAVDAANPALLDAWYVGRTVWGITRQAGPTRLARYSVAGAALEEAAGTTSVCDAVDGVPTLTAFVDDRQGLLLCEQTAVTGRLLARTFNGGEAWERLTDARPLTGLDGPGPVLDLDVTGAAGEDVWTLFPSRVCPQGELRRSTNGGGSFERLPCPDQVDQVLGVGFSSAENGLLLGVVDDQPVVLATTDGGTSWSRS